jgi:glycosyltransferase involved in cell wall biosynthesis
VGGAVVSGYRKAVEGGADVVIKIDGDGQMDTDYLEALAAKVESGEADYVKGNRFTDFKALRQMPKTRLLGNSILSFLLKVSSGYWNIMDPTNGFTAINKETINRYHGSDQWFYCDQQRDDQPIESGQSSQRVLL